MKIHESEIICVTGRTLCKENFLKRIEEIAACRVGALILREKDLSEEEYKKLAESFIEICNRYGVEAILHTFVDTAIALKASSIHLPLHEFEKMSDEKKNKFKNIGVSCHSVADALKAENLSASYITFGHVFLTDCKKGLDPRGVQALKNVCEAVKISVYAIGGIESENIGLVFENGAKKACIMSGFMKCENVKLFMDGLMVGE